MFFFLVCPTFEFVCSWPHPSSCYVESFVQPTHPYNIRSSQMSSSSLPADYGSAQLVQGILIFLSAVVGVVGYIVQSKLKGKERERESQIEHEQHLRKQRLVRVRLQITGFVGPATMLGMGLWNEVWMNVMGDDAINKFGFAPRNNLNKLSNGRVEKYWNEVLKFKFVPDYIKGRFNHLPSFVGGELEDEIRASPKSKFATRYRAVCRRIVEQYAVPLRDLIMKEAQSLTAFPTPDIFKEDFPCVAKSGWLRNVFYIDLIGWTTEFAQILREWETDDFTMLFPETHQFPFQILRYLTKQLSELRELETELGSGHHKMESGEERISKQGEAESKNDNTSEAKSSKKYVAGAAVGAAGATVLASVVSES